MSGLLASRVANNLLLLISTVTDWPASRPAAVPLSVIGLASGLATAAPHSRSVGLAMVSTGAAVSTLKSVVLLALLPAWLVSDRLAV